MCSSVPPKSFGWPVAAGSDWNNTQPPTVYGSNPTQNTNVGGQPGGVSNGAMPAQPGAVKPEPITAPALPKSPGILPPTFPKIGSPYLNFLR